MFDTLDAQQQAAVTADSRACLVLAGPGSGKTTVIVHRVWYLIAKQGVPPGRIIVITYTRAAASEMQQRFEALCPQETGHVRFLTFHAFCFHFLRREGRQFHILSEQEKRALYKRAQAQLPAAERPAMELFFSELSRKKNTGFGEAAFEPKGMPVRVFDELYACWEKERAACGGCDYDDLMTEVWRYLSAFPKRLKAWQEEISHLLVDEAQDMNPAQLALAKRFSDGSGHLFLVGDDDQSIYGFRGSDSRILLSFQTIWPHGQILRLERNYRCAKAIMDAAVRLISKNQNRFSKNPEAVRCESGGIRMISCADEEEEAEICAAYLKTRVKKPDRLTAVLYRSRYQARNLLYLCMQRQIPVCLREPLPPDAGRSMTEDLIAYLMLASGRGTPRDAFRIMNRPDRGLSREYVPSAQFSFEEWARRARADALQTAQIRRLEGELRKASSMTPYAALCFLWRATGYGDWAASMQLAGAPDLSRRTPAGKVPQASTDSRHMPLSAARAGADLQKVFQQPGSGGALRRLLQMAKEAGAQAGPQALFLFCSEYCMLQEELEEKNRKSGAEDVRPRPGEIFFSTFHGSKGMEFDTVVILDANEGYTPCGKDITGSELEEERRLFYVALTRAKNRVRILSAKKHRGKQTPASRFLQEMSR